MEEGLSKANQVANLIEPKFATMQDMEDDGNQERDPFEINKHIFDTHDLCAS